LITGDPAPGDPNQCPRYFCREPSPRLTPSPTPWPREPETPNDFIFARPLYFGLRNNEVTYLQVFLKSQGPAIYPEGFVTGYFGRLTRQAVIRFQAKHGIPQVGIVGPLTREKINGILWNR